MFCHFVISSLPLGEQAFVAAHQHRPRMSFAHYGVNFYPELIVPFQVWGASLVL